MVTRPNIQPISAIKVDANVLVYSDSGTGKSVLGGTAPKGLTIASEKGVMAAARQGSNAQVIPLFKSADPWKDFMDAFDWLKAGGWKEFSWLTIDSLTDLQTYAWSWTMTSNRADKGKLGKGDIDVMFQDEYLKWYNMFKRYVKQLNDLPINVLYICREQIAEDVETGDDFALPDIAGKQGEICKWVVAQMDVVGRLSIRARENPTTKKREEYRRLVARKTPKFFGKDQFDALHPFVDDPTIPKLERLIEERNKRPNVAAAERPRKPRPTRAQPTSGQPTNVVIGPKGTTPQQLETVRKASIPKSDLEPVYDDRATD